MSKFVTIYAVMHQYSPEGARVEAVFYTRAEAEAAVEDLHAKRFSKFAQIHANLMFDLVRGCTKPGELFVDQLLLYLPSGPLQIHAGAGECTNDLVRWTYIDGTCVMYDPVTNIGYPNAS